MVDKISQDWKKLTPDEKREERFKWALDSSGIDFVNADASQAYRQRVQRFIDVYRVSEPDRVPVLMPPGHLAAYMDGTDFHTVMYDYDKLIHAWDKLLKEMEMDLLPSPGMVAPGKVYDILDYKQFTWPGHGIPTGAEEMQFVEAEYMQADEYKILMRDPSDFWLRYYLPRVAGTFSPLKSLRPITDFSIIPIPMFMPLARPETQDLLKRLLEIGQEMTRWSEAVAKFSKRGMAAGYPVIRGGGSLAPFDIIGDLFRGTKGIMLDMYRQPETLLKAMDILAEIIIESVISSVNAMRGLTVTFTLHKGDDNFLSMKQFEKFYWPSLRKILLALIDEGIIPIMFAEGSYNTRLEAVNEFPKGAVAWRFDRTDMEKAKKTLGDKCCIAGNIPSSVLLTGKPEDVKEYCRRLIEVCGPGGGYILAAGASADNINPDNVRAMMAAAREYGRYRPG